MLRKKSVVFAALAAAALASWTHAVDRTWIVGSGTYGTATNWSGGAVPGATDRALFDSGSTTYAVTFGANANVGSISYLDAGTLNLNGFTYSTSNTTSNSVTFDLGGTTQITGGTFVSAGALQLTASTPRSLTLANGATMTVAGLTQVDAQSSFIMRGVASAGSLIVGSTGSSLLNLPSTGTFTVGNGSVIGNGGDGTLALNSGSNFQTGTLSIGQFGFGTLDIGGGVATSTGAATFGFNGTAFVSIFGGTLTTGRTTLGEAASAVGTIDISFASSRLNAGTSLMVGRFGRGDITVRSDAIITAGTLTLGGTQLSSSQGSIRLIDGSDGTFGVIAVGLNGRGTLEVLSGSTVTGLGILDVGSQIDSFGTVIVNGRSRLSMGSFSATLASDGDAFAAITDGGRVNTATLSVGASISEFGAGTILIGGSGAEASWSVAGPVNVGSNGAGNGFIQINSGGLLSATGSLQIGDGGAVELNGGMLAVSSVQATGRFIFNSGTLNVATATIGAGSLFPGNFVSDATHNFSAAGSVDIAANSSLVMQGGSFFAATLSVSNNGQILLQDPASMLSGNVVNSGTIRGTGKVIGTLANNSTGEVRAALLDQIEFTGAGTNNGLINLLGGQVEFGTLTNAGTGRITGRGLLQANAITNTATIALSAGISDVYGNLTNNSGGRTLVSGAANATFYDNVTNSAGSEFRVSSGAIATFFGTVSGLAQFTGTGTTNFEGSASFGRIIKSGSTRVGVGGSVVADAIVDGNLTIEGSTAIVPSGADVATSRVNTLTIEPGGRFDLANNAIVIDYTGASPLSNITILVQQGYAAGAWTGDGIRSSTAAVTPNRAIGIAEGSDIGSPALFAGQPADGSSVLLRYTLPGDADLNRTVNITDFALLAANFNTSSRWSRGDFNYDGITNISDFALLAANFNQALPVPAPRGSVPEPAMSAAVAMVGIALMRLRRNDRV